MAFRAYFLFPVLDFLLGSLFRNKEDLKKEKEPHPDKRLSLDGGEDYSAKCASGANPLHLLKENYAETY